MRLFVAAYPSPRALDDLDGVVARLGVTKAKQDGFNTRITDRALWHVTLAFLGEVPEAKASEAARALDRAGETLAPVDLRLAGGGTFGRGRFTVLWAGLAGDVQRLSRIADLVRRELQSRKVPFDNKAFAPHLTVARPGDRIGPRELAADVELLTAYRGPQWTLGALHLVESHLGPRPTHESRHSARLVGSG